MTKLCRAVEAAKFVEDIIESDGVPKEVKTDNATAFKSEKFRTLTNKFRIKHSSRIHTHTHQLERWRGALERSKDTSKRTW